MLEIIATILIGTGFFLYGMDLIESRLKHITGRRLHNMLDKWTSNRYAGRFLGFFSGVLTHSGSNATLIFTNLVSSHLLQVPTAYRLLAAANIGTVVIVFLFAINLKLGIMLLLGTTAILYSLSKNAKKTPYIGIILGISITLYGFTNLEVGAEHLIEVSSVHHFLEQMSHSPFFYLVLFLLGIALRLLTQSTSTVTILTITLTATGLLTFEEGIFMVLGSPLGAALAMHFEANSIKGIPKQIPLFQMIFEICGSVIVLLLLIIEILTGIPFVKGLISGLFHDPAKQLAFSLLYIRLVPFLLLSLFQKPIMLWLNRLSPIITEETLSAPKYLFVQALEDPETALNLVYKEQSRIFDRFTEYVENIRQEHDIEEITDLTLLHTSSIVLNNEVKQFISELYDDHLDRKAMEKLQKLQNLQDILSLLEESIYNLIIEVQHSSLHDHTAYLKDNIIESLHAVLFLTSSSSETDYSHIQHMTSDKGNLMETIREKYMSKLTDTASGQKKSIIYMTDLYGRIIWLLNRWATLQL